MQRDIVLGALDEGCPEGSLHITARVSGDDDEPIEDEPFIASRNIFEDPRLSFFSPDMISDWQVVSFV